MIRESNIVYRSVFTLDNEEGYRMIRLLKEIYKIMPSAYLKETNKFDCVLKLLNKRKYNVRLDCTLMTDSKQLDTMTVEEGYEGDLPCIAFRFFFIDSDKSVKDLIIIVGRTYTTHFKYFVESQIFWINDYLRTRFIPKHGETNWSAFLKDIIMDYTINSNGLYIKFYNNSTFFIKNPITKFCLYDSQEYTYYY